MVIKQKKESIHATVSPYIKRKAEELVETEEFSSMSDLVSVALAEFIGKYNREQKEKAASKNIEKAKELEEKDDLPSTTTSKVVIE